MEQYKISKFINNSSVLKFVSSKWIEVNDLSRGQYSVNNNIKFNPKKTVWGGGGRGEGGGHFDPTAVFGKYHFYRDCEALIFCDFEYYHNSYLSWKCYWNSSSRWEDMKIFFFNSIFFQPFYIFLNISFLQRNWWDQYITNDVSNYLPLTYFKQVV